MKKFIIKIQSKALGDIIGAMAVVEAYREKNSYDVSVIANLEPRFFENSYPDIKILPYDETEPAFYPITEEWFFRSEIYSGFIRIFYQFDKPLMQGYADQLDVNIWDRPRIDLTQIERPIKSRYACFSMHSTAQCKHWNYPGGWDSLCKMLRKSGITPVCIDRHESFGADGEWNASPKSCVKRHGMNLSEMTGYISHCEFFIGLSSGLSWVAHALGKPVVMISGVTSEDNEFSEDTTRIINKSVCNGCINKNENSFDANDWFWCPVHKGTMRQFECTKTITPEEVFKNMKHLI
jgi:hypothetical protein